jgi:hypothetical protein
LKLAKYQTGFLSAELHCQLNRNSAARRLPLFRQIRNKNILSIKLLCLLADRNILAPVIKLKIFDIQMRIPEVQDERQAMLDDRTIKRATEEILAELDLPESRFEIEPALGASDGETARQIRFFDSEGNDKATVVDFQDKDGNVSRDFEEIKEKIRKQTEALFV